MISFFTKNTPYEQEAIEFIASCEKHGIEHEIEGLESQGAWDRNCAMKPAFILKKLQEKKRALLWVDIDARFKRGFTPYNWEKADFSVFVNEKYFPGKCSRLLSGTLYCSYTPQAISLCEKWTALCENYLAQDNRAVEVWDQEVLQEALLHYPELRFAPLPLGFCKICDFNMENLFEEEIVIEHTQASRRLKEVINNDQKKNLTPVENKVLEFLSLNIEFLVEVDEASISQLEECIEALAFFSFKTQITGNLSHFIDLLEFSRLANLYPQITFSLNEKNPSSQYLFCLRADQIPDPKKLLVWLLNTSWKERLPLQFGPGGPLLIKSGQSLAPTLLTEDIFKINFNAAP